MTAHGDGAGPFLSVLIPLGIAGTQALRESLLCLAGQDDDDFEVLLVAADLDAGVLAAVDEIVSDQPPGLARRVRMVKAEAGPPGAVRNAGLTAARGRYVTILAEGDLALGRWVRAFHEAEPGSGTRLLRALAVTQEYAVADVRGHEVVRAEGSPRSDSPATFSLWQHALESRSPASSWAWPRSLVADHGVGYDPTVTDDPDWELLLRAAELVGVIDVGVVTSLHREWDAAGRSTPTGRTAREVIDSRPLVLPAGEAGRLRTELSESAAMQVLRDELARTVDELRLTHNHAANLEGVVSSLQAQAEKTARRHAKELARLRRKLDAGADQAPDDASQPAEDARGRSWLSRRRGSGEER